MYVGTIKVFSNIKMFAVWLKTLTD